MTDRELERQLRDYFRTEGGDQHASRDLLVRVSAIPESAPVTSPQIHLALLAAAVLLLIALLAGAFAVGSGLVPRNPLPVGVVPTPTSATTPAPTPGLTAVPTNTVATAHIEVDGLTRDYTVVAPPDAANQGPLPLFVILHGPNVTTHEAESVSGADALVTDPGAVLVWAEAYQNSWNAGSCCYVANPAPDDVAFIAALLDHLQAAYPVDPNRVFIGGDGIGGAMAYRAACELSDRFAAVAVVSGPFLVDCTPAEPIPVLHIHGTADTLFPYDGGGTACDGPCPPVAQTMERWRQADGCTGQPTTTTEGTVVTTTFSTCSGGVEVEFVKANGLDTTWGGPGIDDVAVMWAFLMDHARAPGSTG